MHTRASNFELVEPLPEPERTLNRRLCRRNRRVPFDQRNNPPQHPRIVYPPILKINYFHHFLDILRNYNPTDDEPMWAADRVVAPTQQVAITLVPEGDPDIIALDSPYLHVLVTETSQSRQHDKSESNLASHLSQHLFDVGTRKISIVTMNTVKYHSDVLARSQG
ncbi:hypothetical protein Tco_0993803 [Tanacetum coccineum]